MINRFRNKAQHTLAVYKHQQLERRVAHQIAIHAITKKDQAPVIFFNASTRLVGLSYNSAYHQLAAWGLRVMGVPIIHFVCHAGMSRCVQGTNRDNPSQKPPCKGCLAQSQALYQESNIEWFKYETDPYLLVLLQGLCLSELMGFTYQGMPLGILVTPSLRWVLRRYHLEDDEPTAFLFRQYILSAWNIAQRFRIMINTQHPQAVVVFNGSFFPEATVAWVARQVNLRVVTHETGFLPFTGFFSFGEATAYPLDPPTDFKLSSEQNARLDAYLAQRFTGEFSMAGIRFWPEIKGLEDPFLKKMAGFQQIIPVFTNVIFDTSQGYANGIFKDMFDWLDQLQAVIHNHPEALFVFRAHPDEGRKGKAWRESVADWFQLCTMANLPNVVFINSNDYISSYELAQHSKFILVYNSSIGLEAAILGKAVLCAGRVRYHTVGCPTITLPESTPAYFSELEVWLAANRIDLPEAIRLNARKFLYYQVFVASLPFNQFIRDEGDPGFVGLFNFSWEDLKPAHSQTMQVISDGILKGNPFLLD